MRKDLPCGVVQSVRELGQLAHAHRKGQHLTLKEVAGVSNLSMRFLSEFERGKETAEIGKVLKALAMLGLEITVQPRRGGPTVSPGRLATDQALQRP